MRSFKKILSPLGSLISQTGCQPCLAFDSSLWDNEASSRIWWPVFFPLIVLAKWVEKLNGDSFDVCHTCGNSVPFFLMSFYQNTESTYSRCWIWGVHNPISLWLCLQRQRIVKLCYRDRELLNCVQRELVSLVEHTFVNNHVDSALCPLVEIRVWLPGKWSLAKGGSYLHAQVCNNTDSTFVRLRSIEVLNFALYLLFIKYFVGPRRLIPPLLAFWVRDISHKFMGTFSIGPMVVVEQIL